MTAPNGPILFHSSAGSDTQSSGLGPSTAVYGAGASTTAASAVVTGIDTTGVSVGDLLWVQSSSDRQFSIIASVDSSTQVTCDDVFANTESSRTWAVGGKRATFDNADSRRLFREDAATNFLLETETDQTLTSSINRGPYGTVFPFIMLRGSGDTLKTITTTGNFSALIQAQSNGMVVYNLKFVGSAGNTSYGFTGGIASIIKCQFGDKGASTNFRSAVASSVYAGNVQIRESVMYGQGASVTGGYGLHSTYYAARGVMAYNCFIEDFYYGAYSNTNPFQMTNCIVSNATIGMKGDRYSITPSNCIFHSISSHAIELNSAPSSTYEKLWPLYQSSTYYWGRNIFVDVGGDVFHGDNNTTGPTETELGFHEHLTCYLYNASGFTGITFPSVILTADPFVDAANGDFNLNATNGGGGTLRSTNYTLGG